MCKRYLLAVALLVLLSCLATVDKHDEDASVNSKPVLYKVQEMKMRAEFEKEKKVFSHVGLYRPIDGGSVVFFCDEEYSQWYNRIVNNN